MTLKQVNVGIDPDLERDLGDFLTRNRTVKHRSQALALLARAGLDGVVISPDLRQRLDQYRKSQPFSLTLEQVVDRLLREALDRESPQQELGLGVSVASPSERRSTP